ncbi:MAG: DUF2793 domain-containing protein [Thiohalocapsa sp. PB-PSB1]|jgi:hypothetical protein|nr:MAG: DUF2793 domain-containing protein [Thiohalocapsa sp. PB-PSB1]
MALRILTGLLFPTERSGTVTIYFNPHRIEGDASGGERTQIGASGDFAAPPGKVISIREFRVKVPDSERPWGRKEDWFRIHDFDLTTDYIIVGWECEEDTRIREIGYQIVGEVGLHKCYGILVNVIDRDTTSPPTPIPEAGTKYIVANGASGDWANHDDDIAESNGTTWDFTDVEDGTVAWVDDETTFVKFSTTGGNYWNDIGRDIVLTSDMDVKHDVTIPDEGAVGYENGVVTAIDSGKTLTYERPAQIKAQSFQQIKSGAGSLAFTRGGEVSACWFGFGASGYSARNNGAAMAEAMSSISGEESSISGEDEKREYGGTVHVPIEGEVEFDYFTIEKHCRLKGLGISTTTLISKHEGNCVTLSDYSRIEDITLDGVSKEEDSVGIFGAVNNTKLKFVEIKRFETNELRQSGIFCEWKEVYNHDGVTGLRVKTNGDTGFNKNIYLGGRISNNDQTGLYMEYDNKPIISNSFIEVNIEDNKVGADIRGTILTKFRSCWFESNKDDNFKQQNVGVGKSTVYCTGTTLAGCWLDSVESDDDNHGIIVAGKAENFVIRESYLLDQCLVSTSAYHIRLENCYENGMTYSASNNKLVRTKSTNYAEKQYYIGSDTTINSLSRSFDGSLIDEQIATTTTCETPSTMTKDLAALGLMDGKSYLVTARIVGKTSDGSEQAAYTLQGLFYCNGGNAEQIGETAIISSFASDDKFHASLETESRSTSLYVRVTGLPNTKTKWVAQIEVMQK